MSNMRSAELVGVAHYAAGRTDGRMSANGANPKHENTLFASASWGSADSLDRSAHVSG